MIKLIFLIQCIAFVGFSQNADTTQLRNHVAELSVNLRPRMHLDTFRLNEVANYIFQELNASCDSVYFQTYQVNGKNYQNVVGLKKGTSAKTTVVGAHYDVCDRFSGADDNASGIAGLLELARMMKQVKINNSIEFVAYTLEEPPFFRSEYMGSAVHARSLKDREVEVVGMICLEMIGYFSEERKSQSYPFKPLSMIYGNKGNFITLVNHFGKGTFSKKFMSDFKTFSKLKTKKFVGPKSLQGIDFSDHKNYWDLGYSAVMITDTAFYRNKNYHTEKDTIDTLNFTKMGQVVDAVFLCLFQM